MAVQRKRRNWSEVLEEYRSSGLSVAAYCAQADIAVSLFYSWRKRLEQEEARSSGFVELLPSSSAGAGVTVVSHTGWRIQVEPGFDAATLRQVCTCLSEAVSCCG